jgi:dynein heavy chain
LETATNEKNKVLAQAETTQQKIDLVHRLVNGLSSEAVRWKESVGDLQRSNSTLLGDVLLTSAFISYVGPFTKKYRQDLMDKWNKFLKDNSIPVSENLDPLYLLTDDAQIAEWNNEGLPTDRLSTENAVIVTTSER